MLAEVRRGLGGSDGISVLVKRDICFGCLQPQATVRRQPPAHQEEGPHTPGQVALASDVTDSRTRRDTHLLLKPPCLRCFVTMTQAKTPALNIHGLRTQKNGKEKASPRFVASVCTAPKWPADAVAAPPGPRARRAGPGSLRTPQRHAPLDPAGLVPDRSLSVLLRWRP